MNLLYIKEIKCNNCVRIYYGKKCVMKINNKKFFFCTKDCMSSWKLRFMKNIK